MLCVKETMHTSGVVVSSAQLDFGPEELRHFTCASSARAFDFCLVLFALCISGSIDLT